MATPPELSRDQIESFLKQWETHQHSADEQEEFEALEVVRDMLKRIKEKCSAASEACDAELELFERQLAATLIAEATEVPLAQQKIPRSDTTLMPPADD